MVDPQSIELRYAASPFASEYTSIKIDGASSSNSCVATVLDQAIEHIRRRHDLARSVDILGDLEAHQCLLRLMFAASTVSQTAALPCPPLERLMASTTRAGVKLVDSVAHVVKMFQMPPSEQQVANNFVESLPRALQQSVSLSMLTHVSFAEFGLHDAVGPSIVEALMFADGLKVLDLHGNMLGDRTARWLVASSMQQDSRSDEIAPDGVSLRQAMEVAESEALVAWPRLEFLFAHDNAFTASEGLPLLLSSAAIGLSSLVGLSASCVHDVRTKSNVSQNADPGDEEVRCSIEQVQRLQPLWRACVRRLSMLHVDWGYQAGVGIFDAASAFAPCLVPFFQTVVAQLPSCHRLQSFRAGFLPSSSATASVCDSLSAGFRASGTTAADTRCPDQGPRPETMIDLSGCDVHCDVNPPRGASALEKLLAFDSGSKAPVQFSLRLRGCGLHTRDAIAIAEHFGQLSTSGIQGGLCCVLDLEGNPQIDEQAAERIVMAAVSWARAVGRRGRLGSPLEVSLRGCKLLCSSLLDRLWERVAELQPSTEEAVSQQVVGVIVDLGQNPLFSLQGSKGLTRPSELRTAATNVLAKMSDLHKRQSLLQIRV